MEFPRDLAERTHTYYADIRRQITNDHASNCRWMMASLLTLNAGGLLALVNFKFGSWPLQLAGVCFWFGTCFAMLLSWYNQRQTIKFNHHISKLEEFWAAVVTTGVAEREKCESLEDAKSSVRTVGANWLTASSFACFSFGLLAIGLNL